MRVKVGDLLHIDDPKVSEPVWSTENGPIAGFIRPWELFIVVSLFKKHGSTMAGVLIETGMNGVILPNGDDFVRLNVRK